MKPSPFLQWAQYQLVCDLDEHQALMLSLQEPAKATDEASGWLHDQHFDFWKLRPHL